MSLSLNPKGDLLAGGCLDKYIRILYIYIFLIIFNILQKNLFMGLCEENTNNFFRRAFRGY